SGGLRRAAARGQGEGRHQSAEGECQMLHVHTNSSPYGSIAPYGALPYYTTAALVGKSAQGFFSPSRRISYDRQFFHKTFVHSAHAGTLPRGKKAGRPRFPGPALHRVQIVLSCPGTCGRRAKLSSSSASVGM